MVVFSHLFLQPLFPCTRNRQCFTTVTIRLSAHLEKLELQLSTYGHVTFTRCKQQIDSNIINRAASTCCLACNKQIFASGFCNDKKSAFKTVTWCNKLRASLQKRHPREFKDMSSRVFNLSRIVLFQASTSQQFHSWYLNSTNVVGDFILGISSQFYNYKESLDKRKSIFD